MPPKDHAKTLNMLLHAVFFVSGVTTILIGQVLPILSEKFALNDLEAGYFFPAQFSGSLFGTFLTNWFGKNHKFAQATLLGCLLMAAGMLLMNAGSFAICLAGFAVNGIGVGLTLPAINMLVLEMNPLRSASALNILNFFWGAGAIVCKPFVDFVGRGQIGAPTVALAIVLLVIAALMSRLPSGTESAHVATLTGEKEVPIWTTTMAWVLALFNFVHVGFESGIGGWLTTFTDRVEGETRITLISPTFLYFLFFVVGRGMAPAFFRFVSENVMLLVSLVLILAGMVVTLTAENIVQLSIGASLSGFGTSSVFPTNVSRFGRVFGPSATRKATPLFICGTLGSATVTWLIGFLSNKMSDLRSGMYVLAASVVILLVLQVGLMFRGLKSPAAINSGT